MTTRSGPLAVAGRIGRIAARGHLGIVLDDIRPRPPRSSETHLDAALAWLDRAQERGGGGVAAVFDLASGWQPPYPETSGYLIGTFLHHAELVGSDDSRRRAERIGSWLLGMQRSDGAFPGGPHIGDGEPYVFDTGQVLLGLVALAERTGSDAYAGAAARAASWLVSHQSDAGCWLVYSAGGNPHAYDTRVAWALARAGAVLDEPAWADAGRRAILWVLDQRRDNGWIDHMAFLPTDPPLTHTIAYTVEGLLEWAITAEEVGGPAWQAAIAVLDAVAHACASRRRRRDDDPRWVPARFAPGWSSGDRWSCVTGTLQLSLCSGRAGSMSDRPDLVVFADQLRASALASQALSVGRPDVYGGVPGSSPIWGPYGSFRLVNWGAKFLVDSVLDGTWGLPIRRYS